MDVAWNFSVNSTIFSGRIGMQMSTHALFLTLNFSIRYLIVLKGVLEQPGLSF